MDEQRRLRTLALLSFAVRVSAFSCAGNDNTGGDGGILCARLPGTVRERPAGSHLEVEEVRLVQKLVGLQNRKLVDVWRSSQHK